MVVVLKAIILMIQEIEIQFWGLATNHTVVNDGPCILIIFICNHFLTMMVAFFLNVWLGFGGGDSGGMFNSCIQKLL